MSPRLSRSQAEFIEAMEIWGVETGLPRSVAAVLGFLMICEPAHQPAAKIQAELQLSSGAVSSALSLLRQAMLVKRRTVPGHRQYYYEMEPDCWRRVVLRRLNVIHQGVLLAERGLKASPGNRRLADMREVYAIFDTEVERMKKQLEK